MESHITRLAVALAFIAIIFPTTFSAPATRSTCTPVCRKSHESKLNYQEGKTYVYGFETEVVTQVVGSTDETSRVKVKGQATIAAQSTCDFVLTVQQVAIQSPSGQAISKVDDLEGSSLRFAYQDGEIESLCVSDDDPTWSANVKRAIVSMIANEATRATDENAKTIETDISGRCPTVYTVAGNKYSKTKDLNQCTNRDGGHSIFYGVPYNVPSKYNSYPGITSTLTCDQELTNGVFSTVSCVEDHRQAIISTSSSGIQTQIKSSLNLLSTQDGIQKGSHVSTKSSSIFFDHAEIQQVQRQKTSATRAEALLNKLCSEVESGTVSSKVPGLFLQLRKSLKSARKADLKQVYDKIETMCPKGAEKVSKLYLDAAAMSASDGAIAFLAEVIASGKAECHTESLFNLFTTFAPRPGVAALEAAATLISKSDVESKYLLTVSGLAHQYCKMTNQQCGSNNEYHTLVDKIAQHVRFVSDEEGIEKVVAALQALGNLDQLTPAAVTAVNNLLKDKATPERLQVRALDAFRRDPCQTELKQKALEIFSNIQASSQVRIQAYLTLTKCAQQNDVQAVQAVLDAEKSNQVASFVISHIENTLRSASPSRQQEKNFFRQLTLPNNFPADIRKFSRNIEFSTFTPNPNLGVSVDGNLIFSQDSFIPRTTTANLTVDAFGRSYNLLEAGLYAEDFEHLIEKFFGPAGEIKKANFKELVAEKWNKFTEGVRNRFKRDVNVEANQVEIDSIREKVDIHERTGEQGVGDIYIRVMGTSVIVESFSEDKLRQKSLRSELKRGLDKIIEGAKDHKFDITEPFLFIDDEVIIPTSSGLPLNLHLEGTTVLSLQMQGNLDIPALFRGEGLADMRARIMPSAATVIKAKMTVGTGPIESGIQVEGKIHSASGVDLKIVKEDGKFEVKFNLPQERTQIIDIRSDLYWVEQSQDTLEKKTQIKTKLATRSLVDSECSNALSKFLGLKVCADIKAPVVSRDAPIFILNGPSVLSLSVEKSEAVMEGYYLKLEKSKKEGDNFAFDVLLDTPGSRTNRKISANLEGLNYKSNNPEYTFKLDAPWNKLNVEYKRSFTSDLKGINLKVVSDGDAYDAQLQLKKITSGTVNKYEPVVQYTLPGGKPVKLVEGQVVRVAGKSLDIDVRTAGPIKSIRGSIKGGIELLRQDENGFDVKIKNFEISSDLAGKLVVDADVGRTNNVLTSKFNTKYGESAQHTFDLETTIGQPKVGQAVLKAKARCSRRALLNFDIDWSATKEANSFEHKLEYSRGVEEPKVHISQNAKIQIESKKKFNILNELTIKHPTFEIDFYTKADAKAAPGEPRHAELVLNANTLKSNIRYEATGVNLLDYKVNANTEYSGKTYSFSEVSSKVADQKQNFKTRLSVTPGFWYAADTDVSFKFEKSDIESSITSTITSDRFTEPIKFKSGVLGKADGYSAIMKLDMKGKKYVDILTQFKLAKGSSPATLNMKANILNYLESKMTQSLSRSEGKLDFSAKWIPTGRQVLAVSTLKNQGEVYNLDADLKWDAERDPSQAASVKSVTTLSSSSWTIDSQNDITIVGRSSKISVRGAAPKDFLNGDNKLEVGFTNNEGKIYNAATVLNLENKLRSKGAKANVKVTLPEQKPYELTWENRVSNIDSAENTFEVISDIQFDYKGEKDVKLRAEVGSTLPGNFRAYSGKIQASGSVIPQPVELGVKADIKTGKWVLKGNGNRGARKGDFDVTIEYDKWAPKKTLSVKYEVNTPYDRFRTVEGDIKYAYLFNSWTNFELGEQGSFTLNRENPVQWKYLTSLLDNEFKYDNEFKNEGKSVFALTANGKLTGKKLTSSLESTYRGARSYLNVDVDHQLPSLDVDVKGGSTLLKGKQDFELKVAHKKTGDNAYETDLLAKSGQDMAFRVTNKLEVSAEKKSIDLLVSAAEEPTRRVYLLLNNAEQDKYNVEALLRWGDGGKFINSKGQLTRTQDAFDGTLSFDSPELNAEKFNIKLSRKSVDGRRSIDIKVEGNNKEQFVGALDYSRKEGRSGMQKTYEASLKMKGELKNGLALDFDGTVQLEDNKLDRQRGDNEDGRQLRASLEIVRQGAPIKASAVAKTSNQEKRFQVSFCERGDDGCRNGDIHLRHQYESNGDLEYVLRVVAEAVDNGQKSVTGVNFRTARSEGGSQFEHTAKLIFKEDSEQVGWRLYRKDNNEVGAEILLPERVIAAVLVSQNPRAFDYNLDLSFYIDKTRTPNRKISLILNTAQQPKTADKASARNTEVIFRHPDLGKDLKITTKMACGGERTIMDVETVLDVFKANSEIVVAYKALQEAVSEGSLYTGEWSVKSQGQNINFGGKSELRRSNGQVTYKQALTYENRERQVKTAKIEAVVALNRFSLEIDGSASKLVSILSSFESHPSGYEYRQEVLLPGMEDARIVQALLAVNSPRKVQVKTYTSNSPSGVYYEAFFGFRNENNFAAGFYDHEADTNKVLADFNVALNNSRILFVKGDWERQNIKNVFNKAQKRVEKTGQNLKQLAVSSTEEIMKEVQFVSTNLRKASPNFKAVASSAKDRLAELQVELNNHEDTKILVDQFKTVRGYFRQYVKVVLELTKVVRRLVVSAVYALRENLETLPELLKKYSDKIPYNAEDFEDFLQTVIESLVEASRNAVKYIGEAVERISAASPQIIEKINWLLDFSSDAGTLIRDVMENVLDVVSKYWKSIRGWANSILENPTMKMLFKDALNTLQFIVAEFIDESKTHAENFKNYVLEAVPQKEFQELVESVADYVEMKARNHPVDDREAIKEIYNKLVIVLRKVGAEIFSVDTQDGIVIAKIPLPVPIKSLSELAEVFKKMSWPEPPKVSFRVPSYTFGIRETINKLRHGTFMDDLVPPFEGYGLLIGSQYYKTFDGQFFRFEGNCQYLLASDFDNGNFSVVVDYENRGRPVQKSIIVTDSTDTFAIKPDNTVFVNGKEVEVTATPVEAGSFKVLRKGDWVIVKGEKGVSIGCASSQDVCAVKLDGFYHGKVLGLLGKFNQEKFDDMSTPQGQIVETPNELAESWKIENQCKEQHLSELVVVSNEAKTKCAKAFGSSSSLRPSYGVIDTKDYQNICESLSGRRGYDSDRAVCTASLAYVKASYMQSIYIDTVEECRKV